MELEQRVQTQGRPGPSKNRKRASSCAITTVSSLPVSISRMNRCGDQRPSSSPMRRGRLQATFLTTVQYMAYRRRPVSCNRAGSRSVCSILHQRDLCRARSFPLEPSSRGASIPCLSWPVEISWPIVSRRTLVVSDNNIALAQAPYGECRNGRYWRELRRAR